MRVCLRCSENGAAKCELRLVDVSDVDEDCLAEVSIDLCPTCVEAAADAMLEFMEGLRGTAGVELP